MPFIRTNISDMFNTTSNSQLTVTSRNNPCAEFQLNFMECVEAYGLVASKTKCVPYYDDYLECVNGARQRLAVSEMHRERVRQVLNGKRTSFWGPPVPLDAYQTNK